MSGIQFDADAFPHTVTIYPGSYTLGQTGGMVRADGVGTAVAANVQFDTDVPMDRIADPDGNAAGAAATGRITFAANPGVKTDDAIAYGAFTLIAIGPVVPVFGGVLFRTRFVTRP